MPPHFGSAGEPGRALPVETEKDRFAIGAGERSDELAVDDARHRVGRVLQLVVVAGQRRLEIRHSHIGGGGKKGRPLMGWEKGDVARDVDLSTSPFLLRIKSGKRMKSR